MRAKNVRQISVSLRAAIIAGGLTALLAAISLVHATEVERRKTHIGTEGIVHLRWDGPALEPRTDTKARNSPIDIRLTRPSKQDGATDYQIHFIGTRAGRYDLREYLQRRDGNPIVGLSPILVDVDEVLPQNYVGNLASAPDPSLPRPWPYRTLLAVGGVVWLALAVRFVVRRVASRPRPVIGKVIAEPSLADRLRPLVEAGLQGRLNAAQKAQLEQLLIGYWRHRLGGDGISAVELLRRMRDDAVAGELLRQLEAWLHCPPRPGAVDVQQLLLPYRDAAPLGPAEARHVGVAPAMEAQA